MNPLPLRDDAPPDDEPRCEGCRRRDDLFHFDGQWFHATCVGERLIHDVVSVVLAGYDRAMVRDGLAVLRAWVAEGEENLKAAEVRAKRGSR